MSESLERAVFHHNLPERIRTYLREVRGISDDAIEHHFLGWDGHRITIPIFNRDGLFSFFKLAKDPEDTSDSPKMLAPPGTRAELYGWERVRVKPEQIIICEGEFDRLALESRGLAAVTSTGGAQVFRREWADDFKEIPNVYVAFDNDAAGRAGAERVARLIPRASLVLGGRNRRGRRRDGFIRSAGKEYGRILNAARSRAAVAAGTAREFRSAPAGKRSERD